MNKANNVSSLQKQHHLSPCSLTPERLLSHYRTFCDDEWEAVERSLCPLQGCAFYWGPLSVQEAHAQLQKEPVGTYLLRDSSRGNCLFTLSVRMPSGPVSLRISFRKGYFWLKDWFSDCVVRLIDLVVAGTKTKPLYCDEMGKVCLVFSKPLCKEGRMVPTLQELCHRTLCDSSGIGLHNPWNLPLYWRQRNSACVADKTT
ncbi:hypothetical protein JRQ81_016185 [Phrynocephalus forsythii]|uniref:SH2 domain-containing protein n=1 Tax=Phrynocephalus forsythii TaxID=171643 RepID=A0A9Q0XVZ0_9SAUR|nr:hypothetical protein JRQ81_016185 [Phrynocephalus forsythii]